MLFNSEFWVGFHYIKTKQTYNQTNKGKTKQTNKQTNIQTNIQTNKLLNDDEKSRSLSSTVKPVSTPTLIIHWRCTRVENLGGFSFLFFKIMAQSPLCWKTHVVHLFYIFNDWFSERRFVWSCHNLDNVIKLTHIDQVPNKSQNVNHITKIFNYCYKIRPKVITFWKA
jgi:hypothetical protein